MSLNKIFIAMVMAALPTFAAQVVTYTTTGKFTCTPLCSTGDGTNVATFDGGTLTYNPGGGVLDLSAINPSGGDFGAIQAAGFSSAVPVGFGLTIFINQTTPTGDDGEFIANLSGMMAGQSSNGVLFFTTSSVVLAGGVTYTVVNPPSSPTAPDGGFVLKPFSAGGLTTIQGSVGMSPTPEPGTWALAGIALMGIGFARRRRTS